MYLIILKKLFIIWAIVVGTAPLFAQTIFKNAIPIPYFEWVGSDQQGKIYGVDVQGTVYRYDSLGKYEIHYASPQMIVPHLIQVDNPLRMLLFYQSQQEFVFLNRFMGEIERWHINTPEKFIRTASFSWANSQEIWLFDENNFSLQKQNIISGFTSAEIRLDLLLKKQEITLIEMKEYDNYLFVHIENEGILVFDTMGNYQKTILLSPSALRFEGKELYFFDVENQTLHFQALYTLQKREIPIKNPLSEEIKDVLVYKNRIYVFYEKKLIVMKFYE